MSRAYKIIAAVMIVMGILTFTDPTQSFDRGVFIGLLFAMGLLGIDESRKL